MNGTPSEKARTLPRASSLPPTKDPIRAIVDVMLEMCKEGGAAEWFLIQVFSNFEPWHWAAYAARANVPPPTPSVIEMIKKSYAQRVGCEYLLEQT